jgi:hypothetical protein
MGMNVVNDLLSVRCMYRTVRMRARSCVVYTCEGR